MTAMNSIEIWLGLQIALEIILVFLMGVILVRIRGLRRSGTNVPEDVQKAMERFLVESEKLSRTFTDTLRQKKELSFSLLLKLERKINEMNRLLEQAENVVSQTKLSSSTAVEKKANPAAPENRAQVLHLAEQGLSIEKIARKTNLHLGEVELIIDLENQFNDQSDL